MEPEPAGKWVLCNYNFEGRNSSELSVKHRDVLEVRRLGRRQRGWRALSPDNRPRVMYLSQVLDDKRKWWKVRNQQGQEGYVPYNILTSHPGPWGGRSQSPAGNLVSLVSLEESQILGPENGEASVQVKGIGKVAGWGLPVYLQ